MSFRCPLLSSLALAAAISCASTAHAFTFTDLHDFTKIDGAEPKTSVLLDASGLLWGTTNRGGTTDHGTIFSFNPSTGVLTTALSFPGTTGGEGPEGNMVMGPNQILYGTTHGGGANNLGTIYKYVIATGTYTVIYNFAGLDGALPQAGMAFDKTGNLIGTTYEGGSTFVGTVANPGGVIKNDPPATGLGVVFKFNPTSGVETVLHSFLGPEGSNPRGNVAIDKTGTIYGTGVTGGTSNLGIVWKLSTTGVLTTLLNYNGTNGSNPWSNGAFLNSQGLLFSAADQGAGTGCRGIGCGDVVEINPRTLATGIVHTFTGPDGNSPRGSVITASTLTLYGTTYIGGANNCGTIFKVNPNNGSFVNMHDFTCTDGSNARSSLFYDAAHNLIYGTAHSGGAKGFGSLFSITP